MNAPEHHRQLGERIRQVRGGMSQVDFAKQLGIGRTTLIRYESGERVPDASALAGWANLGLDVDFIVTGTPKRLRNRLNAIKASTEMAALVTNDRAELGRLQTVFFEALVAAYDFEQECQDLVDDYLHCTPEDQRQIRQLAERLTPRKKEKK